MEWLVLIIVIYYTVEYIKDKLQIKKWRVDKNQRNYKLFSTNEKTYDGSTPKKLYLDIEVTDGYIIVEDTKYFRNSPAGYTSESNDELIFVEHKHLYYSYSEDNIFAYEFKFQSKTESTDNSYKAKIVIDEQFENKKTTYVRQKQQLSKEDILLNSLGINYIYHMTHIDNLSNILYSGLLSHGNTLNNIDISNQDVNNRRSANDPVYNRPIHSYVPFYFNPRNAMLYSRKEIQDHLVIIAVDRTLIYQNNSLFTDGNAAVHTTKFYKDLNYIQTLDWNCINSRSWNEFPDGKRTKMAETLVFNNVPSIYIKKLYCKNYHLKQYIESLLSSHSNIKVEVNKDLFF